MSLLVADENMTLGDFLKESEFFDYSEEYQELLKECYEVEMAERYLESQQVLQESGIENPKEYGLMTEADDSTIKKIADETKGKAKGIWEKIKNFVYKIWNAIKSFFSRIIHFWENGKVVQELAGNATALREKFRKLNYDNDEGREKWKKAEQHCKEFANQIKEYKNKLQGVENDLKDSELMTSVLVVASKDDANKIAELEKQVAKSDKEAAAALAFAGAITANTCNIKTPEYTTSLGDIAEKISKAFNSGNVESMRSAYVELTGIKRRYIKDTISADKVKKEYAKLEKTQTEMNEKINAVISDLNGNTHRFGNWRSDNISATATELQKLLTAYNKYTNTALKTLKDFSDVRTAVTKHYHKLMKDLSAI